MSDFQVQRYAQEGGAASGHTALLSPWATFIDIEPMQWRRLYDWLLPPNQANTDLFVLHDRGQLLTVNPAYAHTKLNIPEQITDPADLAHNLHAQWQRGTVVILERSHYRAWLDDIQRETWIPGDDLLAYGLKIKDHALRHAADKGIVLYPSPLNTWQDITPELLSRLGQALSPNDEQRGVVLTVYEGTSIWLSLILIVQNGQVQFVTTLPSEDLSMSSDDWRDDSARIASLVEKMVGPVTLGIFCDRQTFETLGFSPQYWPKWIAAQEIGDIVSLPMSLQDFAATV